MEDSEISGYDEASIIHMDLRDAEYQPIDVQYLDTDQGLLCITHAITPLGFNCYVVSPSERHTSPTLEHIGPFIDENHHSSILLKCGHKASGAAIRFADKVNFNWEEKSYNFRSKSDHSTIEEITPIITSTQLLDYPQESLITMHDLYRSIRSDQVLESTNSMDRVMELIGTIYSKHAQAADKAYESLLILKDSIDPLTAKPCNKNRNIELSELVTYREMIICKLLSIARKENVVAQLATDYDELNQLVNTLQ